MALPPVLEQLNRRFRGAGGLPFIQTGAAFFSTPRPTLPTGILSVDLLLGGGLPRGAVTEIWGKAGTGKTTLAIHAVASAQRRGMEALFIAAERPEPRWFGVAGVDPGRLYFAFPRTLEAAFEAVEAVVRRDDHNVGLVVLDSVAALAPRTMIEDEHGSSAQHYTTDRRWSEALQKIGAELSAGGRVSFLVINQIRLCPEILFGNRERPMVEQVLSYWSSARLHLLKTESIKHGGNTVGMWVRVMVKKLRHATPFRQAEVPFRWGLGFSVYEDLVRVAAGFGIVEKEGGYFYYDGIRLGALQEAAVYLETHPDLVREMGAAIREHVSLLPAVPVSGEEVAEDGNDGAGPVGLDALALVPVKPAAVVQSA